MRNGVSGSACDWVVHENDHRSTSVMLSPVHRAAAAAAAAASAASAAAIAENADDNVDEWRVCSNDGRVCEMDARIGAPRYAPYGMQVTSVLLLLLMLSSLPLALQVLNLFNNEWTQQQEEAHAKHFMLQMEFSYRQQQQQQQQQHLGFSRHMMGGSIVEHDPSVDNAAAASAAAASAASHRTFVTRHHGQDITCLGQSVSISAQPKPSNNLAHSSTDRLLQHAARSQHVIAEEPGADSAHLSPFSLEEHKAKYDKATERAWR
jgi:hypothetical protein